MNPAGESIDDSPTGPMLRRSLVLMQSLAPRQTYSNGYAPAHLFLSQFWQSRKPQTPITQTLAMQHEVAADPRDAKPAIRLAKFIAKRGYNQQALDILDTFKQTNADVLLVCGAVYEQMKQPLESAKCFSKAEVMLNEQLAQNPADVELRQTLSRTQAVQGRLLESMLLLAEGCQQQQSAILVDSLIGRYTMWLSGMSEDKVRQQLQDISLALQHSKTWNAANLEFTLHPVRSSSGEEVMLPGPIVAFHSAMLSGEGKWLVPLLLGTDAAGRKDYSTALKLLNEGMQVAPEHPVIANNLAWTLLQDQLQKQAQVRNAEDGSISNDPHDSSSEDALVKAWRCSEIAIAASPDKLSYRETRGLIAAETGRWQIALDDLQMCADAGFNSIGLLKSLALARKNVAE